MMFKYFKTFGFKFLRRQSLKYFKYVIPLVDFMDEKIVVPTSDPSPIILPDKNESSPVSEERNFVDTERVIDEEKEALKQKIAESSTSIEKEDEKEDEKNDVEENIEEKSEEKSDVEKSDGEILEKKSLRVATGISGFDGLIDGGFEKNSMVLVVGSAGTGKTLFSMQFLYEGVVKYGEPGIFISFEEEEASLYTHALQFGWDFKKLENENKFRLLSFKPHQVTKILEEGGGQIRDALIDLGAKRIVIDSITAYGLLFSDEYKRREKILEFFNLLKKWGVTAIIIVEDNPVDIESERGSIGFISDAVVAMYYQHDEEKGIRTHSLEIIKMRGTKHTNKLCAINFEDTGITVYPDVEVF
jgi:KaiC/GvpD/RAD55 family RecA-like ATPase